MPQANTSDLAQGLSMERVFLWSLRQCKGQFVMSACLNNLKKEIEKKGVDFKKEAQRENLFWLTRGSAGPLQ